jgi:hypothetical protein
VRSERRSSLALGGAVLAAALACYAWNLATLPPLTGYDADGHMHYVATLLDEGRLPHPLEGWSSFHPPLYHLLVAWIARDSVPVWNPIAIGAVSALAALAIGAIAFAVLRRLSAPPPVAAVASAVLLFDPCVLLAATTVGNEALGAAFCALALAALTGLQRDPRSLRLAAAAGVAMGLALLTKSSALLIAPACIVPFLRRDADRRCLRAAALLGGIALLLSAPVYLRNLALTGTALPMTRERPLVALNERALTIRERRASDYLWIDPGALADPLVPDPDAARGLNPHMTSVWGLAYASAWFDAHGLRVSEIDRPTALAAGRLLLALGAIPTALLLLGFALAWRDLGRNGSAARDAPLAVAGSSALLGFVAFTARVPTTAAVKSAYLLPVALCAPVFFARGVCALGPAGRRVALLCASLAPLASAVLLSNGVLLPIHSGSRDASPLPPRLAAVAAEIDAASAGRWRGIQLERAPDGTLVWKLEAFAYSPVSASRLATWCRYLDLAMRRHLPRRRWRASISQEGRPELSCDERR